MIHIFQLVFTWNLIKLLDSLTMFESNKTTADRRQRTIFSAIRVHVGYLSNPETSQSAEYASVKAIAVSFLSRSWRDDSQEM